MPDHLSIEVFGLLRGSADGPMAVGVLGLMALTAISGTWRRRALKRLWSTIRRNVRQKRHLAKGAAGENGEVQRPTGGLG